MEDSYLRPVDVARRLGVSKATVYTLIRTGQLASRVALAKGSARPLMAVSEASIRAYEAEHPKREMAS